ncbi:S-layer homology domain-containing protein [Cohnella hashimotonis]|uniref:S-layer homology domain-containing protein n=1 Tax=Cohnella hashimotonis TaxID=2826895 RepID=A0ABT6TLU0_9BACL|nr:S-layer homology domain-containing protein [Cohnella hashimotonis]MDI4647228.1 S-layer homology domain-containing protein [Cohnella hashimotonis]
MLKRVWKKGCLLLLLVCLAAGGSGGFAPRALADAANVYEAESPANTLAGNAAVADSEAASGGKKVGGLYQGSSIRFNGVAVDADGTYKITVDYVSGDQRSFNISANGGGKQYEDPPKTADWDTVGSYELTLALKAGVNAILIDDNNWYAPDIDRIVVGERVEDQGPGAEEPDNDWQKELTGTTFEAEAPGNALAGHASVSDSPVSSGGKKVGDLYQGSSLTFKDVNAPAAGIYLIRLYYISGDQRPVYMKVNDGADSLLDLPKTADWNTVGTYDASVELRKGANEIVLSDHDWYSPDIDRIEVIPFTVGYEAEDEANTLSGNASVSDSPAASGGKKVGGLYQGSSIVFSGISAPMTSDYKVVVSYISGDPRGFYIRANNGADQYIEPPKTPDWDTVGTVDVTLSLQEGDNTIAISDGDWYAPDIDRIVVEPAKASGTDKPDEELGTLGDAGATTDYGAISVTQYTYGLMISNGAYDVSLNDKTGYAGYDWKLGQRMSGAYGAIKLGDELLETKAYAHHEIAGAPTPIEDGFGKGVEIAFVHTSPGKPTLKQIYKVYENKAFFLARLDAAGDAALTSNYMAPIALKRKNGVDIGVSADNRVLTVPFDNDAWVRYKSQPMNRSDTSYEATAIYNASTRAGLVLGSVTHDVWKTGIDWTGASDRLNALTVYGGAATPATRDSQPHGSIAGSELSSPTVMVGAYADYRDGLTAYGDANAVVAPKLELGPDLPDGVPVGWNSWGAYGSSLSLQNVLDVSDYFKNTLTAFNNDGNVYINMDSYWDNLNDEQLAQAVAKIKSNGQHAGIYWAPFVYWGNNMSQPVDGTDGRYTYGDIVLKGADGQPLPTLDGAYPLDVTHPGARLRMDYYLNKFKALGFTYIKLDFLTHGSLEGQHYDPAVTTGIQAYNQGMAYMNRVLDGKMFISESIAPIFPSQYAHARRISCDTYGKINETEYELNSLTYGFWQNGTIYGYTDPDHLALSRADSLEEARSRVNSGVISGTVLLDSDDVNDPKAKGYMEALYGNRDVIALALKGKAFRPLEGNTGANAADAFVLKDGADFYLAVFNYSASVAADKTIDLGRAGLDASLTYAAKDLWTGEASEATGTLQLTLAPAASRLLQLTAPAGPVGQPGNQPGNGASDTGASGAAKDGKAVLTEEMLRQSGTQGAPSVELKNDVRELVMSGKLAASLAERGLTVRAGALSLELPADVLKRLLDRLPAAQRDGGEIALGLAPVESTQAAGLAEQAGAAANAQAALKGGIYVIKLTVKPAGGTAETVSEFGTPIVLTLRTDEGFDFARGGIYRLNETGKPAYVPGKLASGSVTAGITGPGVYAVLALDRTFGDVPADHWAAGVIREMAAKLYVEGTGNGAFNPGASVTRAEFAVLLVRGLGLVPQQKAQDGFADVDPASWYAGYVAAAAKQGLATGRDAAAFAPNAPISREEIAVMLMRAYAWQEARQGAGSASSGTPPKTPDAAPVRSFADAGDISSWAAEAVNEAAELGLLQGRDGGRFAPQAPATRAEATQLLYALIRP